MSLVKLISYTPSPQHLVALSARICYASKDLNNIEKNLDKNKEKKLINKLIKNKHYSPFEHAVFTFYIGNISRACMSQLTRHRIASFSVRSQRYIDENNFNYIIPGKISGDKLEIFNNEMKNIRGIYNKLKELGLPNEDARSILPNACTTQLITTFNARSLFNFFELRLSNKAQCEIREVANKMLLECYDKAPLFFSKYIK